MKTYRIIFLLLMSVNFANAQTADTLFNYKDDYILNKIVPALPQGWTFSLRPGEFVIEKNDSVIVANKSLLKVPANKKIPDDSILKYGYKTKSIIVYRYDNRWTYEQTLKANSYNLQIYQLLRNLPEKYKITQLLDKSKSTRGNNVYTGKTEAEKNQIMEFEKERSQLFAKIIQMPNYHTEKYSLFLKSTQGCDDDNFTVFPGSASLQLYEILVLFSELTEKSN